MKERRLVLDAEDRKRFWAKVDKNGPIHPVLKTRCWLWTAGTNGNGYGLFSAKTTDGGRNVPAYAHRVVIELEVRPLKYGEKSLHRCDVTSCVNYESHLFIGTQADNVSDAGRKGKMGRRMAGERNPRARIDDAAVRAIRAAKGTVSAAKLANRYGLVRGYIYQLWNGARRK